MMEQKKLEGIVSQLEAAVSRADIIELVGDGSCGKTTALKELQNRLGEEGIRLGIFTDEQIVDSLLSELSKQSSEGTDAHRSFRNKYLQYDVIAIDDFDLLSGRPVTMETLMLLLHNMPNGVRPLILAERSLVIYPRREWYIVETIMLQD